MSSVGRIQLPVPQGQLPVAGTAGTLLLKQSNTDYDLMWGSPVAGEFPGFFPGTTPQSTGVYDAKYQAVYASGTGYLVNGPKTWYMPAFFAAPAPVAKMTTYLGIPGSASAAFIFSVYSMGSDGLPATVLGQTASSSAAANTNGTAVSMSGGTLTVPAGWGFLALTSVANATTVPGVLQQNVSWMPVQLGNNGAVPSATTGFSYSSANGSPVNNPSVSVETQPGPWLWLVAP